MQQRNPLLGTLAQVEVTSTSAAIAEAVEDAAFAEAERLEALFTIYDDASAVSELRRAGTTEIPELRDVIQLSADWRRRTRGAFSQTMQPLIDLWNLAEVVGVVPSDEELAVTVQVANTGLHRHADFNGIAKGWIADRSVAVALDTADDSVKGAWLNIGGDLVHSGGGDVVVGIEDPDRPYDNVAPLCNVTVSNEALATSGGGRRWWIIDGLRYAKVLDPRTGRPATGISSASVVASSAAVADVLATVALVLSPDETLGLVADVGAEVLLVLADGEIVTSSDRFRFG